LLKPNKSREILLALKGDPLLTIDLNDDKILTMPEVSHLTRVPMATLRHWRATKSGGPRSARLGGRVVYLLSDVQAWINEAFGAA
jgi:predicted DNA-binding transcriptional regulator AlpA